MTIHIGAQPGDIAETVLMPGDPYRARWAAENFLQSPRLVNETRGMLGFTGTWKGNPVTIHGSGMGGMQPHVKIRDVVLAMTASTLSSPSRGIFRDLNFAPYADYGLLAAAHHAASTRNVGIHVGGIYSSDVFYDERPDLNEIMTRHGILCVEMETAELYNLCARHGVRGLGILTISDHLQTGEALPAADRERSFGDMIEIALGAAFA